MNSCHSRSRESKVVNSEPSVCIRRNCRLTDGTTSISIDTHEKLHESFSALTLSKDITEGIDELSWLKSTALVLISDQESCSQLHDVLQVDSLRCILLPINGSHLSVCYFWHGMEKMKLTRQQHHTGCLHSVAPQSLSLYHRRSERLQIYPQS